MPDRIDRVVAIGLELANQALGQSTRPGKATHLLTHFDHALARLRQTASREFVANHVGQREHVEASRFQELDELALARPISTCDSDNHGRNGP